MALSIKDPKADKLAREVASLTGETLTEAVATALRERLERERRKRERGADARLARIQAIARRCASRPVRDLRPADEILGYDDTGAWD